MTAVGPPTRLFVAGFVLGNALCGVADFVVGGAFRGPAEAGKAFRALCVDPIAFWAGWGADGFTAVFLGALDTGPSADIDLFIVFPYPLI